MPQWDLAYVLNVMTGEPFEPLRKVPLMCCTLKTVFLLALASAKRRGEIHAWTRQSFKRAEDWSSVSVAPSLEFVAKTELASKGGGRL